MPPFIKTEDMQVGDRIEPQGWPHLEGIWEITQKGVMLAGKMQDNAVLIKQGDAVKYCVGGLYGRVLKER